METILGRRRTAPTRAAIRGERMTQPPQPTHDAPMLNFGNGVTPRAHFASAEEYSIQGRLGEVERRIDTAPLHTELSHFPTTGRPRWQRKRRHADPARPRDQG